MWPPHDSALQSLLPLPLLQPSEPVLDALGVLALLAIDLVPVLGPLSLLMRLLSIREVPLLLRLLLVLPGLLLLALPPEMLLSGLVLGDLVVLDAPAELVQPPLVALPPPRGFFSPRLFFFASRQLLPLPGLVSLRLLLSFAVSLLPAPPNDARGLPLPVAELGTPRSGFDCCRPKLRTLCERLRKRRSIHYVEKLLAGDGSGLRCTTKSLSRHRVCQSYVKLTWQELT